MNACQFKFEYQVDPTTTFELEAEFELHHSTPHYIIKNIHLAGSSKRTIVLPDADIRCIIENNEPVWVHTDSNKSSPLSISIGRSLEQALPRIETADHVPPSHTPL